MAGSQWLKVGKKAGFRRTSSGRLLSEQTESAHHIEQMAVTASGVVYHDLPAGPLWSFSQWLNATLPHLETYDDVAMMHMLGDKPKFEGCYINSPAI